jgi:hypothetical protein
MGGPPPGGVPPQPGYTPQPGYGAPMAKPDAQGAMVSMILGIIALILTPVGCCCGFVEVVPIVLGIVAVVMGIGARNRVNASGGTLGGGGKAQAGIITGIIAVILGVVFGVLYAVLYGLGSSGVLSNIVNQLGVTPSP